MPGLPQPCVPEGCEYDEEGGIEPSTVLFVLIIAIVGILILIVVVLVVRHLRDKVAKEETTNSVLGNINQKV